MTFAWAAAAVQRRRSGRFLLAASIMLLLAAAFFAYPVVMGYSYYHGYAGLKGRIAGHDTDLPAQASRCANCHDRPAYASSVAQPIAPLDRVALLTPHSRRGGPATAFSEESFCALLRDGIDPAMVMVNRTMPRFDLTQGQCHALWRYVLLR